MIILPLKAYSGLLMISRSYGCQPLDHAGNFSGQYSLLLGVNFYRSDMWDFN